MLLLSQTFFLAPKRAFLYLGGLRPKLSLKGDAINLHEQWMRFALRLAETGRGQTSPNPMVGAVVVKEGNLLGFGAHLRAGTPHAEVHALNMAGPEAKGATLYVTLEPCNHYGRTPPCTERIIGEGIRRVVVAMEDPEPFVSGRGIERLRQAGIEVVTGVLEDEARRLNEAYVHHRLHGRPFVTLKTAATLDGKIATRTGDSRWVTGEEARRHVHRLRREHDAVLVAIGTVLADRPRLTVRLPEGGRNPLRVVLDSRLRIPLDTPVTDVSEAPTWVFCTERRDRDKEKRLRERGVEVIVAGEGPRVDLGAVFDVLGKRGILSVLAEGGGELNAALLEGRWVQKAVAFVAPKWAGGRDAPSAVGGVGVGKMADAIALRDVSGERFGEDVCITGYPVYPEDRGSEACSQES